MIELLRSKIKPSELYILDEEVSASGDKKQSEVTENNFFDQVVGDDNKTLIKVNAKVFTVLLAKKH